MKASKRAAAWLLAIVIAAVPSVSLAQQGKWFAPYKKGVDAYNDKKWAEAITFLMAAIAADPVDAMNKCCAEGNATEHYMPHLYLAGAYMELGNAAKARETLKQFRAPANISRTFSTQRSQIEAKLPPPEAASTPSPTSPPPPPPGPTVDSKDLQDANRLIGEKKLTEAIDLLDRMQKGAAADFNRRGLNAKLNEAKSDLAKAQGLLRDANQKLNDGDVIDARKLFGDAEQLWAGSGQQGIRETEKREKDFSDAVASAQAAAKSGDNAKALADYNTARSRNSQRFGLMNLDAVIRDLSRPVITPTPITTSTPSPTPTTAPPASNVQQAKDFVNQGKKAADERNYGLARAFYQRAVSADSNNAEAKDLLDKDQRFTAARDSARTLVRQPARKRSAITPLQDAQSLDPTRFQVEQLDKILADLLKDVPPPPQSPMVDEILKGVTAYLEGDAAKAISALAPVAANPQSLDKNFTANLHGYLGAAYGTLAIVGADGEREQNRRLALEQFRAALKVLPDFTLSQRWVSEPIQALFKEARGR